MLLPRSLAIVLLLSSLVSLVGIAIHRFATRHQRDDWRPYGAEGWYGWWVYYHPNDDRLFVPNRYWFGWTTNWAHPVSWAISIISSVACVALASLVES
ncbi:MAG: DUF5808 domain-containing protein [Bacteroidota bacterium]